MFGLNEECCSIHGLCHDQGRVGICERRKKELSVTFRCRKAVMFGGSRD